MPKSLNIAKIFLGIAIACTIVAGGVYGYFFVSMKNKTQDAISLASQLSQFSGEQLRYASSASALQNEQANVDKLSSYFIKQSQIVSFTKKVEALGTQAGMTLSIESLDPVAVPGGTPLLNFRVVGTGKFGNVQRLLTLLENFPGKLEWRQVQVSRAGGTLIDTNLTGSKTGRTVKDNTPMWSIDASLTALNYIQD